LCTETGGHKRDAADWEEKSLHREENLGTEHGDHPKGHGRLGRDIWALSTEITRRDTAGWERKVAIGGKVWALSPEVTREDAAGWEE
jgi:hypothetical protein